MSDNIGKRFAAVTKSDTTLLNGTLGLYVGGLGDVTVKHTASSAAVKFAAVPAGTFLPIEVALVMSTGTTATEIVALYS